ncbi:MAG: FAD-monooxygenase, partial [Betaproteobacteria bacterium]
CFGRDFTLLCLDGADHANAQRIAEQAQRAGLPLETVSIAGSTARELYGAGHILIRPDHHVGWRGDRLTPDFDRVLSRARGG